MTMMHETLNTCFDVEAMPDYEGISLRFRQGFGPFVTAKKYQAVRHLLSKELCSETMVRNPDFVEAVVRRLDDEAVQEKRYVFISVVSDIAE